jgi:hypothetical protein
MFQYIREYLWFPKDLKKYRSVAVAFLVFWAMVCILLLIPQIREGLLFFIERWILNRPLGNPMRWQQTLLVYGLIGIIAPVLFFFGVFLFIQNKKFFGDGKNIKVICYGSIIFITASMIWLVMYRNAWILGDDYMFLSTTALNKYLPFDSYAGGRFFPLGHFHYNILLPLSYLLHWREIPASAHFALNTVIYTVSILFLYLLFRSIEPEKNKKQPYIHAFFLCFFPLFSVACVTVFMQCIFPETVLTALLSGFVLCYYRALKTNKGAYYIIALLFALYSTYCKEPVFGTFFIIAMTNFIFGYKQQTVKSRFFHIALIANAVLFAVLYYILSYSKAVGFYNEGRVEQNLIKSIAIAFIQNKLFILMIPFFLIRLFYVLVKKDRDNLYYDSLLFAGSGYIVAYIILNLNASYYFFPSVIFFIPCFVYWIKRFFKKRNKFYALAFLFPVFMICSFNFSEEILVVKDYIHQREGTMPFISGLLADYTNGGRLIWYEQDDQNAENPFYIIVRNWQKNVVNVFISYKRKSNQDYLTTLKDIDCLYKNDVFIYSKLNNYYQSVPNDLLEVLSNSTFDLDTEIFNISVYKYAGKSTPFL